MNSDLTRWRTSNLKQQGDSSSYGDSDELVNLGQPTRFLPSQGNPEDPASSQRASLLAVQDFEDPRKRASEEASKEGQSYKEEIEDNSQSGNARKLVDKRLDGNSLLGKLSKLGLAPILLCVIFLMLVTYMHSVVTAAGLILFYRCSSKDPGYIRMNVHDSENVKDDEPLLKIEINNPALLAGNWSQLCATCKKNKWDFFLFLVLEVVAMLIKGAVALTRVLTDPLAPSTFGAWLSHAGN
ncbi:hypothetical protein BUALT_Bualt12G0090700 [Buddleja alternifolia]|uniref:Uncharacterized protein n=1 Tax=Buddleja alternifolia TaxID=168488 RepID=A0AAV6WRF6_9LAMI|nr:hypothetical protein BUALT_Bualt12G0090700 [Buddleja alternifolia]